MEYRIGVQTRLEGNGVIIFSGNYPPDYVTSDLGVAVSETVRITDCLNSVHNSVSVWNAWIKSSDGEGPYMVVEERMLKVDRGTKQFLGVETLVAAD